MKITTPSQRIIKLVKHSKLIRGGYPSIQTYEIEDFPSKYSTFLIIKDQLVSREVFQPFEAIEEFFESKGIEFGVTEEPYLTIIIPLKYFIVPE